MNNKNLAIVLILTMAISNLSLLTVKPASAQIIPKPSVPEFTLTLVDDSYDVPPTSTVNPYTGKTETSGGYHVTGYLEIHIKIKNQPFTQYYDTTAYKNIGLFYKVQTKGHFSQNWGDIEYWIGEAGSYNPRTPYKEQDYSSQYTLLKYYDEGNLPREGQIDFRVQALIGFPVIHSTSDHIDLYNQFASFSFNGTTGDWSNTQTINLAQGSVSIFTSPNPTQSPTNTPSPTPTPSVPEFPVLVILPFFVSLFLVAVYFKHRRTNHESV